jgi:hypothetical protein
METPAATLQYVLDSPSREFAGARSIELTVVPPCLNEAETRATCINRAQRSIEVLGVDGVVLVADDTFGPL